MEPRQNHHEAAYWDQWNALNRETGRGEVSVDQARVVRAWLNRDCCTNGSAARVGDSGSQAASAT